jgi:hypothetical protein
MQKKIFGGRGGGGVVVSTSTEQVEQGTETQEKKKKGNTVLGKLKEKRKNINNLVEQVKRKWAGKQCSGAETISFGNGSGSS